jgi:hypothetical protein
VYDLGLYLRSKGAFMKHGWLVLVALASALAAPWLAGTPRAVYAENGPANESYSGEALCLPDA